MKPFTRLYLKAFLWTGIPYALIMLGFDLAKGDGLRFGYLLFMTLIWAIPMSLILVSFHKYGLKKNEISGNSNDNVGVHQTRNLKSSLNTTELIAKLKSDPILGKLKMREVENGILLKTSMSWKSWGEEIKIKLNPDRDTDFEYQISSSPKLKTTLVDYGKNIENVNRVEEAINGIA